MGNQTGNRRDNTTRVVTRTAGPARSAANPRPSRLRRAFSLTDKSRSESNALRNA